MTTRSYKVDESTMKVLFRIPFTVYFVVWDSNLKLFLFATKQWSGKGDNPYYWSYIK